MGLGEGIFFGLALVALVILYVNTNDRWNWGKPFSWFRFLRDFIIRRKRPLKWIASITLVALVGVSSVAYWLDNRPYVFDYPEPVYVTSFWDLTIGASKSDVLFEKGEPDAKFVAENKRNELWAYAGYGPITYSLNFKVGKLAMISIENPCKPRTGKQTSSTINQSQLVNGVMLCNPTWVLLEHVGEPEDTADINGGLRREYIYRDSLNVSYVLERGRVISMSVGSTQ